MEVSFDVKITPGVLYDYLLYHTYTGTTGLLGITLKENDELIGVRLTDGEDNVVLVTRNGLCITFDEKEVRLIPDFWCGGACVSSLDIIYPVEEAVSCKSCI